MKILLIDNYDSFTYNLVHLIEGLIDTNVTVVKNDVIKMNEINSFDKIILSPGPGVPKNAGKLLQVIETFKTIKPIFGVCLGQQAIAEAFGGSIINLSFVYHGVATPCNKILQDATLLKGIADTFTIGRYHSWVVNKKDLPKELLITAEDSEGNIMALQHKQLPIHSVQFHPESILTPDGAIIMNNFLAI